MNFFSIFYCICQFYLSYTTIHAKRLSYFRSFAPFARYYGDFLPCLRGRREISLILFQWWVELLAALFILGSANYDCAMTLFLILAQYSPFALFAETHVAFMLACTTCCCLLVFSSRILLHFISYLHLILDVISHGVQQFLLFRANISWL